MHRPVLLTLLFAIAPYSDADATIWDWSGGDDAPVVTQFMKSEVRSGFPNEALSATSWLWSETGFVGFVPPEGARWSDLSPLPQSVETAMRDRAEGEALHDALLHAVITAESSGNAKAVSPAGAEGLMQLMPATAKRFGVSDSFDAEQNIRGGSAYLRFLLDRYEGDVFRAAAAYNAGEGRVDRGVIPAESRDFATRVVALWINELRRMTR